MCGAQGIPGGARALSPETSGTGTADVPRLTTLPRRADFLRAARAFRQGTPGFLLQARQRAVGDGADRDMRFGLTCSKKVGNAVSRNRARRRLRAVACSVLPEGGQPGWDYVLVGRPEVTLSRDYTALEADLRSALARLHRSAGPTPCPAPGGTGAAAPLKPPR